MKIHTLAVLGSLAALAGCPHPDPGPPDVGPIDPGPRSEVLQLKSVPNPDLDLLFVIDDSATMQDKQQALVAAFPAFIEQLGSVEGGLPSLHIGVVSSDMGTKGSSSASPAPQIGQVGQGGCVGSGKAGELQTRSTAVTGKFIEDLRGASGRQQNYTGSLADVFRENISLGGQGCGFEQHLHAMRASFGNPANAGFRRVGANLGIVILADEDDCSVDDPGFFNIDTTSLGALDSFRCFRFGVECTPDNPTVAGSKTSCHPRATGLLDDAASFRSFLAATEPDSRKLMLGVLAGVAAPVAVTVGPPPGGGADRPSLAPSCSFNTGGASDAVAAPAVRLAALAADFPGRSRFEPLCNANVGSSVTALGKLAKRLAGDSCLERAPADSSGDPGIQTDCVLIETRDSLPGQQVSIPRCDGSGGDCFDVVEDATRCSDAPGLRLSVTRAQPAADDAWLSLRCTTTP